MAVTILDGSFGEILLDRFEVPRVGAWSALMLMNQPEGVVQLHKDYIDAGVNVITTNTYATIPNYLKFENEEHKFVEWTQLAGQLAQRAVRESGKQVKIAGCIPPLAESYRSDIVPPREEAEPIYEAMVKALVPYVDLFLCETISLAEEAHTAASSALTHGQGKPVWVSWTPNDTPGAGIRSGESMETAFNRLSDLDVSTYLVNCTTPESCIASIRQLKQLTSKPIGCYPNKYEYIPSDWTLDANEENPETENSKHCIEYFTSNIRDLIAAGATVVGGCCGVGPDCIAAVAESVKNL